MTWMSVGKAGKKYKIKSSLIHNIRLSGIVPKWMEKRGKLWWVDIEHNGFKLHIKEKEKKRKAARVGHATIGRKENLHNKKIKTLTDKEMEKLENLSTQADLSKSITSLRLQTYKIETEKLKLEQAAGDLISRPMADFLYFGYLSRLNRELFTSQNKLEAVYEKIISNLIMQITNGEDVASGAVAREMRNLNVRETEDVIKVIKEEQIKQIQKFADDIGFKI